MLFVSEEQFASDFAKVPAFALRSPRITKFALLGIFAVGLHIMNFPFWHVILIFLAATSFLSFERVKTISALNLISWFLVGSVVFVTRPEATANFETWPPMISGNLPGPTAAGLGRIFGIVLFALCYFGIFQVLRKFAALRYPILWCTTWYALLWGAYEIFRANGHVLAALSLLAALFILSKAFWMSAYQLSEVEFLAKRKFWEHLGTLNSPWQFGWTNCGVVRGHSDYLNHKVANDEKLIECQISAVKLIFWAVILKGFAFVFHRFIFQSSVPIAGHHYPSLRSFIGVQISYICFMDCKLSLFQNWIFLWSRTLLFLVGFTASTHTIVAIARMAGLSIRLNVERPYRATSFNDFLARIYFYYVAILQRFFFFPIWRRLRIVGHKRTRIFLTFFLTIIIGGIISSLERNVLDLVDGDTTRFWRASSERLPYFGLLAFFCAATALMPSLPKKFRPPAVQALMVLIYFSLYSLCFFLQMSFGELNSLDRLRFFGFFFGFQK